MGPHIMLPSRRLVPSLSRYEVRSGMASERDREPHLLQMRSMGSRC